MGYQKDETDGAVTRYRTKGGNVAATIVLEHVPQGQTAGQGAGLCAL
jgi:glyoxalase family protein